MDLLEMLKEDAAGHAYTYTVQDTGVTQCVHHTHYTPKSNCWRAELNKWFDEHPDPEPATLFTSPRSTDGLAQEMMKIINGGQDVLLTKYVFYGEGLDHDGDRAMVTAATDNIAPWDEAGLLKYAEIQLIKKELQR